MLVLCCAASLPASAPKCSQLLGAPHSPTVKSATSRWFWSLFQPRFLCHSGSLSPAPTMQTHEPVQRLKVNQQPWVNSCAAQEIKASPVSHSSIGTWLLLLNQTVYPNETVSSVAVWKVEFAEQPEAFAHSVGSWLHLHTWMWMLEICIYFPFHNLVKWFTFLELLWKKKCVCVYISLSIYPVPGCKKLPEKSSLLLKGYFYFSECSYCSACQERPGHIFSTMKLKRAAPPHLCRWCCQHH